jgi:2-amino-4-hydroxy-6-hydroxymethyldihydropteridine diphosphokinase
VRAYVAVGTNLGDRWAHLRVARRELHRAPRLAVLRASRVYDTVALDPRQPRYLNAVLELETGLMPEPLLALLLGIEAVAFRRREARFSSRTLDLDLVLYEDLILSSPRLILPHPRLAARRFVLGPLAELSPERNVPGHRASVAELLGAAPVHDMRPVGLFPV